MRRSAQGSSLRRWCAVATAGAAASGALLAGVSSPAGATHQTPVRRPALYLVTLSGADSSTDSLLSQQDRVLSAVGSPTPIYRWTTALNGVAVRLTTEQASELGAVAGVTSVERNSVQRLAAVRAWPAAAGEVAMAGPSRGGAGVVIGVVDSGLDAANPLFAAVPGLGRAQNGFDGRCETAEGWAAEDCTGKVVGARWFIGGFGADRVRSTSSLSPIDDNGHGTLVAAVAAGNSGISVEVGDEALGAFAGTAPQARLAVYKACWTAPDPSNDGCATADLVTAIDRATADGVDVLNLAVAGGGSFDTVDRALLGATESGVFVAAAAGNDGRSEYAAHANPWVTTVGAVTGPTRGGMISLGPDGSLSGAMSSRRPVTGLLVSGADAAAPGVSALEARLCLPGSLDAALAAGRIVICDRGTIGRVDKSLTVALADGVGMVLANLRRVDVHADFQTVPTLHLDAADAQSLRSWLQANPSTSVRLRPGPAVGGAGRLVRWSAAGDPRGDLVKPDLTAPGVDVLGATPPSAGSEARWSLFSGTSAATARVSGHAAVVLARHRDWSPARVRSALMTTSRALSGGASSLSQGAGRTRGDLASRPGLVYDLAPGAYRRYLAGSLEGRDLNLPSIKASGPAVVTRTVTNVGARAMYYSVRTRGFTSHRVSVTPVAIRIPPGASRTFTVAIAGTTTTGREVDSGWITWRGANGTRVRIPVVISD